MVLLLTATNIETQLRKSRSVTKTKGSLFEEILERLLRDIESLNLFYLYSEMAAIFGFKQALHKDCGRFELYSLHKSAIDHGICSTVSISKVSLNSGENTNFRQPSRDIDIDRRCLPLWNSREGCHLAGKTD